MKTGEEFGLILVVAESGVEGWYARAQGTCDVVVGVAARRRRRLGRGARLLVMAFFPLATIYPMLYCYTGKSLDG